ncbi:MAG: TonB-dependent receptor [Bacteroidota bacterium]|nr:TonB-dependent receptor [Bacteroidota bacterium]
MNLKFTLLGLAIFIGGINLTQAQDTTKVQKLKEVIVIGKRAVPERLKEVEGVYLFSGKKNEVIKLSTIDANLTTNNPRQLFSRVPGVSIWENDGSGTQVSVGIRGLNPNRSWEFNTRQNGYDISSDIFGYPEAYYNPPMEAVDKIEIVRGGASLQFGSQFGGLLNYVLKKDTGNKPFTFQTQNTIGSYGMLSSYNAIRGNTKKWNYSVYNHYRKGDGWRQNGQYEVRNTHGYLQYKINEKSSLSAEISNMDYEIQQSGGLTDNQFKENHRQSVRQRNWFSTPWNVGAINFDTKYNEKLTFNVKVFGLIGERNSIGLNATPNITDTYDTTLNDFKNRQIDRDFYKNIGSELRGVYSYNLFKQKSNLAFGGRVYQANTTRKQRGKGDAGFDYNTNLLTEKFPAELEFKTSNIALFAENQFKIGNNFSVTPGVRYENIASDIKGRLTTNGATEVNVTPKSTKRSLLLAGIGLEYKFKTTNLYANISQAYRPVLFSDLTPPATTDVIDENLKDANGFNADFGYRGSLFDFVDFDVSAFYIQYNNRIGTIRQFLDNDPTKATYQYRTNLGKSANQGIEAYIDLNITKALQVNKKVGNLSLFASLAFINAEYKEFKTTTISGSTPNIVISESNLKNKRVEYAPNQIHNIGLTYAYKGFSTTFQTRISSEVFTDATNTETPNSTATIGKIDGYQVYDLSMEYKFMKNYNVRFSINNLTDSKYATRRAGGYPGPGLIPGEGRTLNLGVGVTL